MTIDNLSGNRPIVLRIAQSALGSGQHRVAVRLDHGRAPLEEACEFSFQLSAADREDVRWYLEDYLSFPQEAAPQVAARVERRLAEIGVQLFDRVFEYGGARKIWGQVSSRLSRVRVEISTDLIGAAVLPWELLRDPGTGVVTALAAESFVRVNDMPGTSAREPSGRASVLRVLLAICRPEASDDIPFRSVAGHLVRLRGLASDAFQLDVLRPATFARLAEVLERAQQAGRPYHAVHFDGHGTYIPDHAASQENLLSPPRPGAQGYLVFEEPTTAQNRLLVDGPAVGALLARTGVSVLVLNACRSAYADEPEEPPARFPSVLAYREFMDEPPGRYAGGRTLAPKTVAMAAEMDPASRFVRFPVPAYSSLALEVAEAGVAGVIAMRYSVYAVTAARFVADLYDALLAGQALGTAATTGRRQLAAHPDRAVGSEPRSLQDWSVPVVYEPAPLPLFTPAPAAGRGARSGTAPRQGRLRGFPQPPDTGFVGRDEMLIAIDRRFDSSRVVLLHGTAGSGKTATAAEFARWYLDTGGLVGPWPGITPVLFSNLETCAPVARMLDLFGDAFRAPLNASDVDWQALDHAERRRVMLETFSTVPALWVWDSIESISGFRCGSSRRGARPNGKNCSIFSGISRLPAPGSSSPRAAASSPGSVTCRPGSACGRCACTTGSSSLRRSPTASGASRR